MTSKIYHTKHIIDLTLKNSDYIAEKVSPKKTLSVVSTYKKENYKINSLNLSNKLNFFNMNKNTNHYFLHTNFWLRFMLNHKNKKIFQNKPIKPIQIKVIPHISQCSAKQSTVTYERTYSMAALNYHI